MGKDGMRKLFATLLLLFIVSALIIPTTHAYDIEETSVYSIPSGINIGPSNPLYGLKLAFEDLDETFTPSDSDRIVQQMENAELRISEARAELLDHNIGASKIALERYREKVNQTIRTVYLLEEHGAGFSEGLLIAERQQYAFEELISGYTGNRDLLISYENSIRLREIFDKTSVPIYENTEPRTTTTQEITQYIDSEVQKGENKGPEKEAQVSRTPTPATTPVKAATNRETVTNTPAAGSSSNDTAKNTSIAYDRNSGYSGDTGR